MRALAGPAFALALVSSLSPGVSPARQSSSPALKPAARDPQETARLRQEIRAVLAAPILARSYWAILVKSLDRGDVLFEQNAGKLVMPASNMKVITMAAAAERLGWDHRFETTLESAAPVAGGVLQGDLIVRGGGDPGIGLRDNVAGGVFDTWADQLRTAGIREISGRVIADDSALDDEELGAGWAWDDMVYAYAGPVSAAFYNESMVRITLRPGPAEGDAASIDVSPPFDHGLTIRNLVTTAPAGSEAALDVRRERGSRSLTISGTVPADVVDPPSFTASVENPALFLASSLKSALIERGIQVSGDAADADALAADDPARAQQSTRVLARYLSDTLREIGRTFMKSSRNPYGELLVKALGRAGGEGSTTRGQEIIEETLDAWEVPRQSYVLADGSGLSRLNYLAPDAIVRVLEQMHQDPRHREAFIEILAIAAQDGTLRNRLRASWTAGRVHAKTGSLSNTRALSGYLTTRSGEQLVFSIVANNSSLPGWRIERVIDLLVEILARH